VREYAALRAEALVSGAKIFFVDEAHFRADVELRSQWVLHSEPTLVDSTSPRFGEKATYYSAVCLETGQVLAMPVEDNTNAVTSVAFLKLLREKYNGPLIVIGDIGPAHRGEAMRTYLTTPKLQLRLMALPAYSPDFNPDEAIWEGPRRSYREYLFWHRLPRCGRKWMNSSPGWRSGQPRLCSVAGGTCKPWPINCCLLSIRCPR
jgi:transposase